MLASDFRIPTLARLRRGGPFPLASGGTIFDFTAEGARWRVHTFTESDVLAVMRGGDVEFLLVGGGGGGTTAGGGGGGVVIGAATIGPGAYPIVVGAGGGYTLPTATPRPQPGYNGSNSMAFGLIALGGGGGGGTDFDGIAGASGGGAASSSKPANPWQGGAGLQPGSVSGGHGNAGGSQTIFVSPYPAAGGGGAGAPGEDAVVGAAGMALLA